MKIRNRKEAAQKAKATNLLKHGESFYSDNAKTRWSDPECRQTGGFFGRSDLARQAARKRWARVVI